MKILLTGCAGFIGSNLLDHFLSKGHTVIGVDNLSTGHLKNIEHHSDNPKFKFFEADICDDKKILEIFELHEFESVCHQAALGSVPRSVANPIDSYKSNVMGTIVLLDFCRRFGISRFVFASSSSVYGDDISPVKKEDFIGQTLSPYAQTKKTCEDIAFNFGRVYGIESIALRYFNVFGPRQNPNGPYAAVIPKWIHAMKSGNPIIVFGDGSTSRDFCYIQNVIHANELALTTKNPRAFNQAFNIACEDSTSLNCLLILLKEIIKPEISPTITYAAKRTGDIAHSRASCQKAREILFFENQAYLIDGLTRMLA